MPAVFDSDNGKVCAHIDEKDGLNDEYDCEDKHLFVFLVAQIVIIVKDIHIQQHKCENQVTNIKNAIVICIA